MKHDSKPHGSRPYDYTPILRNAGAFRANYDTIAKDHWKCPAGVRNAIGDVKCWHCGAEKPKETEP